MQQLIFFQSYLQSYWCLSIFVFGFAVLCGNHQRRFFGSHKRSCSSRIGKVSGRLRFLSSFFYRRCHVTKLYNSPMDVYPESLELDRNQYLSDVTSFEFGELCSCCCKLLFLLFILETIFGSKKSTRNKKKISEWKKKKRRGKSIFLLIW